MTPQIIENNSIMNKIYQNTITIQSAKEKIWTIPLLVESPKIRGFQSTYLEIDFLNDSGAESNIINIPKWNEIQTPYPSLSPSEI